MYCVHIWNLLFFNILLFQIGYMKTVCLFLDLNDFPKSLRDPINAKPYQGIGIECYPPTSGYPGKLK